MSLNGPSLTGLRRVLAEDKTFARVQAEASRPFTVRSEDYQLSAPAGTAAALLARWPTASQWSRPTAARPAARPAARRRSSWPSQRPAARPRTWPPPCAPSCRQRRRRIPSWETLPHERLSPRSDTVGRRLSVLRRLAHPETAGGGPLRVVVAPVRAVVQPIVAGLGELVPVTLSVGQDAPFGDVVKNLADAAYAGWTWSPGARVRGPRRHAGRLPAHRGPPDPGRVLRRRGRADALVRRRRPALADRTWRAPPHRTARPALPRNPDHAFGDVPGRDPEGPTAGRGGHAGENRRRHRRRRHGVTGPGAGRFHGAVLGPVPGGLHLRRDRTRKRSAPAPTTSPPPTRSSSRRPGPRRPTAEPPRWI